MFSRESVFRATFKTMPYSLVAPIIGPNAILANPKIGNKVLYFHAHSEKLSYSSPEFITQELIECTPNGLFRPY